MMKRALLISYYYPPLGGIGSQRSQKFVRYLPDYGWQPVVLTPEQGAYFTDATLDDGTASGAQIIRTPALDLSAAFKRMMPGRVRAGGVANDHADRQAQADGRRAGYTAPMAGFLRNAVRNWVYIPDGQVGWFPYALRAGKRALRDQQIDAIYSTSFPITAHLVAYRLKLATNKPWVADFRDLWTENHYVEYSSALRKRLDQIIESRLLEKADAIVAISETMADTLREMTGGRKRVEIIRNGFDPADFAGVERRRPSKWTITYVGTFYGAKQDPSPFLSALQRLIESGRVNREEVSFTIVGQTDSFVASLLPRFNLQDVARFTGFVSHRESVAHQVNSSLLLIILHADRANSGVLPGKLFEYLGARRPILALVPEEFEAARVVRATGAGATIEASDEARIEERLLASYRAYKSGEDDCPPEADLSAYERKAGAGQLARLMSELMAQ